MRETPACQALLRESNGIVPGLILSDPVANRRV